MSDLLSIALVAILAIGEGEPSIPLSGGRVRQKSNQVAADRMAATEAHFRRLLHANLTSDQLRAMAVAGGPEGANETIENVKRAGIKADFLPAKAGFSDFIVNREGEDFLKT